MGDVVVVDFDSVEGWQTYLDETFADGFLATQILYSEGSSLTDESPQILMSFIRVVEIEDDGGVLLSLVWAGIGKDTLLAVESVEERPYGCYVVTAETDVPDYLFSRNISETQRQAIKREREEGSQ